MTKFRYAGKTKGLRLLLSIGLTLSPAYAQSIGLEHGVRKDVYQGLSDLKELLSLSEAEFNSLLAWYQQIEIAATSTNGPTDETLAKFTEVQYLTRKCGESIVSRAITMKSRLPYISNTLDESRRVSQFLRFTDKMNLKSAEIKFAKLSSQEACQKAAALVVL